MPGQVSWTRSAPFEVCAPTREAISQGRADRDTSTLDQYAEEVAAWADDGRQRHLTGVRTQNKQGGRSLTQYEPGRSCPRRTGWVDQVSLGPREASATPINSSISSRGSSPVTTAKSRRA